MSKVHVIPFEGRNRSEYSFTGRIRFQGIPISVENRKGSTRSGKDRDGKAWSIKMHAHYGEVDLPRVVDNTGEKWDIYVADDANAPFAYVVRQLDPWKGGFDEPKIIVGCGSIDDARELYFKQYAGPERFWGGALEIPVVLLRDILKDATSRRRLLQLLRDWKWEREMAKGEDNPKPTKFITLGEGETRRVVPIINGKIGGGAPPPLEVMRKIAAGTKDPEKKAAWEKRIASRVEKENGLTVGSQSVATVLGMSPEEMDKAIRATKVTIKPVVTVEDWGNRGAPRGAGRRGGGMIQGAMSSPPVGKKSYPNFYGNLPEWKDDGLRAELSLLRPWERDKYLRARSIGLGHDAAMIYADDFHDDGGMDLDERQRRMREFENTSPKDPPPERLEQVGEHIWGSRKDLERMKVESTEDLERLPYDEATKLLRKSKLIPAHDLDTLRAFGVSPGTAHMVQAMFASVGAKPRSDRERSQYFEDVNELVKATLKVKTLDDFRKFMDEVSRAHRQGGGYTALKDFDTRDGAKAYVQELTRTDKAEYRIGLSGGKYRVLRYDEGPFGSLGKRFLSFAKGGRTSRPYEKAYVTALDVDGLWGSSQVSTPEEGWDLLRGIQRSAQAKKAVKKAEGNPARTSRGWSGAKEVASEVIREGHGRDIPHADAERTRKRFNLREIDYGTDNYMSQADREYHTRALEGALEDLAHVLEIAPDKLALNGRLGIAMGARGRGKAAAHYERGRHVINITKFRGGGSLAHEFGHALDNVMAGHLLLRDDANTRMITEAYTDAGVPQEIQTAVRNVVDAMEKHPDPQRMKEDKAARLAALRSKEQTAVKYHNEKLREAKKLLSKPTSENVSDSVARLEEKAERYRKEKEELQSGVTRDEKAGKRIGQARIQRLTNLTYWEKRTRERTEALKTGAGVQSPEDVRRASVLQKDADTYLEDVKRLRREMSSVRRAPKDSSHFYQSGLALGKGYWGNRKEMFARAYEAYVEDKLRASGRRNTYLVDGTQAQYAVGKITADGKTASPYPEGEERQRINAAMDGLMKVLVSTGAMYKGLEMLKGKDKPDFITLGEGDSRKVVPIINGKIGGGAPPPLEVMRKIAAGTKDPEKKAAWEKRVHAAEDGTVTDTKVQKVKGSFGAKVRSLQRELRRYGWELAGMDAPTAMELRRLDDGWKLEVRGTPERGFEVSKFYPVATQEKVGRRGDFTVIRGTRDEFMGRMESRDGKQRIPSNELFSSLLEYVAVNPSAKAISSGKGVKEIEEPASEQMTDLESGTKNPSVGTEKLLPLPALPEDASAKEILQHAGIRVEASMTTPSRRGKKPRPVWNVVGATEGYDHILRDELGGKKFRGKWSFWDDPTEELAEHVQETGKMSFADRKTYAEHRAGERSDRLAERSRKHQSVAESAQRRRHEISDSIPFGQPILVGHHSEKRARRDADRIFNLMGKEVESAQYARELARRSGVAAKRASGEHSVAFMVRRKEEAERDARKIRRLIKTYTDTENPHVLTLRARLQDMEDKAAFWSGEIEKKGGVVYKKGDVTLGDKITYRGKQYEVTRVNPKSVTVKGWLGRDELTWKVPYEMIQAHKKGDAPVKPRKKTRAQMSPKERLRAEMEDYLWEMVHESRKAGRGTSRRIDYTHVQDNGIKYGNQERLNKMDPKQLNRVAREYGWSGQLLEE